MRYTTLISAVNLAKRCADAPDSVCIFDCRFDLTQPDMGAQAYAAGHIENARYLHLDHDLSGQKTGKNGRHPLPEGKALAKILTERGLMQHQQVIAYDAQGGIYAARLWWLLRWLGHDATAVLDGGLQAWQAAGHPLTANMSTHPNGNFRAQPPLTAVIGTQEVIDNLTTQKRILIDARASERYRGENETLDPVGGHIPGALNHFFKDNLTANGYFKNGHELREAFTKLLGNTPSSQAVLQCGSGVSACHNALAMEIAGLHGAALYPGSWSEWSADPARPITSGAHP